MRLWELDRGQSYSGIESCLGRCMRDVMCDVSLMVADITNFARYIEILVW